MNRIQKCYISLEHLTTCDCSYFIMIIDVGYEPIAPLRANNPCVEEVVDGSIHSSGEGQWNWWWMLVERVVEAGGIGGRTCGIRDKGLELECLLAVMVVVQNKILWENWSGGISDKTFTVVVVVQMMLVEQYINLLHKMTR